MSISLSHKRKYTLIITAGNETYTVEADNTDPINDDGSNPPQSGNPAPPAAPFPAKVPPSSTAPVNDGPAPKPEVPTGPGTEDDNNPEYVGNARKIAPKPLPNPEGGGLAPNPDNDDNNPKGGLKQDIDSLDDHSAKPNINNLNWYMGKKLAFKLDPNTGLTKFPLDFDQIEKDFKRPNKPPHFNTEPQNKDNEDATKVGNEEKPYVATT